MCFFSAPKPPPPPAPVVLEAPKAPPAPPTVVKSSSNTVVQEPPAAPQEQDFSVRQAREKERLRRRFVAGNNKTLITGGEGLTAPASTSNKQLFGQ